MLDQRKQKYSVEKLAIESRVLMGYPSDKITESIREQGIDLVIMGTTGLQGIGKVATIGSVARKVSEESPCPVILVHYQLPATFSTTSSLDSRELQQRLRLVISTEKHSG